MHQQLWVYTTAMAIIYMFYLLFYSSFLYLTFSIVITLFLKKLFARAERKKKSPQETKHGLRM